MKLVNPALTVFILAITNISTYAQNSNCIVIGSTQVEVQNAFGAPSKIQKLITEEIWYYNGSTVSFREGKVAGYDNSRGNLRICKEVKKSKTIKDIMAEHGYLFPERSTSTASKSETEEWIVNKLNAITPDDYTYSGRDFMGELFINHYKNTKFSIEDGYLVVSYNLVDERHSYYEIYKIPINDLQQCYSRNGALWLITKTNSMYRKSGDKELDKTSSFSFDYNFNQEDNLLQRLQSAFTHLLKFYQKPKSKEVF